MCLKDKLEWNMRRVQPRRSLNALSPPSECEAGWSRCECDVKLVNRVAKVLRQLCPLFLLPG